MGGSSLGEGFLAHEVALEGAIDVVPLPRGPDVGAILVEAPVVGFALLPESGRGNGGLCGPIGPQYRNGVLGGPIGKHGVIWVQKWGFVWPHSTPQIDLGGEMGKWGFVWPHREAWRDLGGEMGFCVSP